MAADWFAASGGCIGSFLLSFVLIGIAWMQHHRLLDKVERVDDRLVWLSIAWMLTIVWLPVPTALVGQLDADWVQKVLYIGTLVVSTLLLGLTRLYLRAHPQLHAIAPAQLRLGFASDVVTLSLYVVALVIALFIPGGAGFFAMFVMVLVRPLHALVRGWMR